MGRYIPATPAAPVCPAKTLTPERRQELAVQALAGATPVTELAAQAQVSRQFVHRQQAIARAALDDAFSPTPADDAVLFSLPVTRHWLRQFTLSLVLIGHSSLRGVVEILRDCFDTDIALGTVHAIVQSAVAPARRLNDAQNLSGVRVGAHDEIFQNGRPVLVGCDAHSTYCYLLSAEDHRDGDTWGVRLLEARQHGLNPDAIIADAANGLRAGATAAFPEVPCRSDVFHVLQEVHEAVAILENKAYSAMKTVLAREQQLARARFRGHRDGGLSRQLADARRTEAQAIDLADAVALLARWLRHDILGLAGPRHPERCALFDFVLAELHARAGARRPLLTRLVTYLAGQRDDVLAFAAQLDRDLDTVAQRFAVAPEVARDLFAVRTLDPADPRRSAREAPWRQRLGRRHFPLGRALDELRRRTVRASSVVENLNSRLRGYFFLRRTLGNDYLALLQFFLNHRRLVRSAHPERIGHSPAELLTGQAQRHWLEQLGYRRFQQG